MVRLGLGLRLEGALVGVEAAPLILVGLRRRWGKDSLDFKLGRSMLADGVLRQCGCLEAGTRCWLGRRSQECLNGRTHANRTVS